MLAESPYMELTQNLSVSRETVERLEEFQALLLKWTRSINLISKSSISNSWTRHIVDSAQIYPELSNNWRSGVDLGSGGGFPALVLACISKDLDPARKFTLVESDSRKCAFLQVCANTLSLNVDILECRLETLSKGNYEFLTARALAPMTKLFEFATNVTGGQATCLLLKGESASQELKAAQLDWTFEHELLQSVTDPRASIVKAWGYRRANP